MKFHGKIINSQDKEPLQYATVYFSDASGKPLNTTGTISNEFGRFSLDYNNQDYVTTSFVGFAKKTTKIPVSYDAGEILEIQMEPTATELSGVEIIASPIKRRNTKIIIAAILISIISALFFISKKK